jgi:hypothetical protein
MGLPPRKAGPYAALRHPQLSEHLFGVDQPTGFDIFLRGKEAR